jgi:hypothetical protein
VSLLSEFGGRWIEKYCHISLVVTVAVARRHGTCRVPPTTQSLWRRLVETSRPDMQHAVVNEADFAMLQTTIILQLLITTL